MRRRTFIAVAGAAATCVTLRAVGQAGKPVPRVAFLSHSTPREWGQRFDQFRAGLRALGYVEGRGIIVEAWWAEDRLERLPALIAEILSSKPAVIVTHGSPSVAALQRATRTVPIVFAAAGNPVGQGFIKSYRQPGGNITGVVFTNTDNKALELVKVVMPRASRVGVLINPELAISADWTNALPASGKALGIEFIVLKASALEEVERASTMR